MEFSIYQQQTLPWQFLAAYAPHFSHPVNQENFVHWSQTPESHIYSADLPGVKKEEIKVEIEDSIYMVIRTEAIDESNGPAKSFMRKFRLPNLVDIDGISAGYENGVLTITVPRSCTRRTFFINPSARLEVTARAA